MAHTLARSTVSVKNTHETWATCVGEENNINDKRINNSPEDE